MPLRLQSSTPNDRFESIEYRLKSYLAQKVVLALVFAEYDEERLPKNGFHDKVKVSGLPVFGACVQYRNVVEQPGLSVISPNHSSAPRERDELLYSEVFILDGVPRKLCKNL